MNLVKAYRDYKELKQILTYERTKFYTEECGVIKPLPDFKKPIEDCTLEDILKFFEDNKDFLIQQNKAVEQMVKFESAKAYNLLKAKQILYNMIFWYFTAACSVTILFSELIKIY
jgi:hypothetical protein